MHAWSPCARARYRDAAFSLFEIMFVVVIISLLAMPAFTKVRRAAQSNRFISDLRNFTQAFEGNASMNGAFPANAPAGMVP